MRQRRIKPVGVQRRQEIGAGIASVQPAHPAIGVEPQAVAIAQQQQVPARQRIAAGDAFQQQRKTRRVGGLHPQQVGAGSQLAGQHRGMAPGFDQIVRNTRVPLVPPKPKPLDTATSTFFWRATLGT